MMKKFKILLVDDNDNRRHQLTEIFRCYHRHNECCLDPRPHIEQKDFENSIYDIAIVHHGNDPEGVAFEEPDWELGDTRVILFSGGFSQEKGITNGIYYVSAPFIENIENFHQLLEEVIR